MSEHTTYRRARNNGLAGDLPAAPTCVSPERLGLRDYWASQDLLHTTGSNHLRRLLSQSLNRLAELEHWTPSRTTRRATP